MIKMVLVGNYCISTKNISKNCANYQKYFFIIGSKRFASYDYEPISIKDYLLASNSPRIKAKAYETASKVLTKAEQNRLTGEERASY